MRDRLRPSLVPDRASAHIAFPSRRSNERPSDVPSLYRTCDCHGWRDGVTRRLPRSRTERNEDGGHVRDRAVPVRKRLRHIPKERSLERRGIALARRGAQESTQWERFDELRTHINGEGRL